MMLLYFALLAVAVLLFAAMALAPLMKTDEACQEERR